MTNHYDLYNMSYINILLQKIEDSGLDNSEIGSKIGKHPQIITDLKNGKRKQLYVDDLISFCKALNYDFFKEIQEKSLRDLYPSETKFPKKVKVNVTIEVDDDSNERKILETILDKPTVKKLIG